MTSSKKDKFSIKSLWIKFTQKVSLSAGSIKSRFSLLTFPLKALHKKYRRRPRALQIVSIYLLVIALSGAIYVWRSSQMRTINPYKLKFAELEEDNTAENGETTDGQNQGKPAIVEPDPMGMEEEPVEPLPVAPKPPSGVVWPVQGRLLRKSGEPCLEVLGSSGSTLRRTCKWIEIEAEPGAEVCSMSDGEVLKINNTGKPYGKEMIILHGGNLKVYYGALDQIHVTEKEKVARGTVIATLKENPEGEKSYLYLEIQKNGRPVNPLDILPPL